MKYSKKELIAKVSEKTGYQEENIAEIYEALEETVYNFSVRHLFLMTWY